jgi:hypothetical protein
MEMYLKVAEAEEAVAEAVQMGAFFTACGLAQPTLPAHSSAGLYEPMNGMYMSCCFFFVAGWLNLWEGCSFSHRLRSLISTSGKKGSTGYTLGPALT